MIDEDVDSALLRLFECFMEAAPQLTLQLYIMQTNGMEDGIILGEIECVPGCRCTNLCAAHRYAESCINNS